MPPNKQLNARVLNLINYIKQNSTLNEEVLKSSSIVAGYTEAEFNEAWTSVEGNLNQASGTETVTQKSLPLKLIISVVLLVVVIAVGIVGYLFLLKRPASISSDIKTQANQFASVLETPTTTPAINSVDNPLRGFLEVFKAVDYKVTTHGKFNLTLQPAEVTADLDGMAFYFKKGQAKRYDYTFSGQPAYVVFSGENYYLLSPTDKSYLLFNKQDGEQFYSSVINAFPLLELFNNLDVSWAKVGENEWQSTSKLKYIIFPSKETDFIIKISSDQKSKLINSMSIKFKESDLWQTVNFTYEELSNLDSLLAISPDYKKKEF